MPPPKKQSLSIGDRRKLTTSEALDLLIDPTTGKIPMEIMWRANAFSLSHTAENLSLLEELVSPHPDKASLLIEALSRPGRAGEKRVPVPLRNRNRRTLTSNEWYGEELMGDNSSYPYGRDHKIIFERYAKTIGRWIKGSNLLELCTGEGKHTAFAFKTFSERPHRVIGVDIESECLDVYDERLKNISSPIEEIIKVAGNCITPPSYCSADILAPDWQYFRGDVLQALKDDPRRTVCMILNTASNFPPNQLFAFLRDNFKPGTLFLMTYCNNTDIPTLRKYYGSHIDDPDSFIVKQWIMTSAACEIWRRGYDEFDPTETGACVMGRKVGGDAELSFNIYEKKNPTATMRSFSPIGRQSVMDFRYMANLNGLISIDRLRVNPLERRSGHAMWAFCHKGKEDAWEYAKPLMQLVLGA